MNLPVAGHLSRRLVLFVALICLTLVGLEAWHQREQRLIDIAQTETAALNVARAVAREADATFRLAETILFGITQRLRNEGRSAEALDRLSKGMSLASRSLDSVGALFVYDADGNWIASSLAQMPAGVNNADRAYFQFHKTNPSPAPHLSEPIRSRSSGSWIILVSQRLQNPDGSFAGVAAATVDVERFIQRLSGFDLGSNGTVSLLTRDGRILARQPFLSDHIGRDISGSPLFQEDLPKRSSGVGRYVSPVDGTARLGGFATASVFPVVAFAALSEDEALAAWRAGAFTRVAIMTLLLVFVAGLGMKLLRDVRRRERAEAELAGSEARYRLLSEAATDMVTHMDLSCRRLYVSPASRILLGFEPDELVGTRPQDAIHPDDAESLAGFFKALASGECEQATHVYRLRHRDGHWVWVEASLTKMLNAEGALVGFVASVRDISARKAAEAAAADSEARYREVLDASHDTILGQLGEGVIVTDVAGRITLVNEAAAAIHGVARLDIEPDAYSDSYRLYTEDGDPYPPHDLPLACAVRGETITDARWRIRRPDGTEALAIGCARPVRGRDGAQIGSVLTLRDDTGREAAERALRELNATLSERVAARTYDVEVARADAERASAAKSDFLAAMSHEIRTPLNGILGYADLLLEEPVLSFSARRHGERIQSAGAALLTVVNDILDFSKIEAGQIELTQEPFALAGLVDNAISIVRTSAERKGLDLRVELDPILPSFVIGDQDRLRQVVLNLLNNAIKFTRTGAITLLTEAMSQQDGRVDLRLTVRDTGIGIPQSKRHLLFERFSQIDGTIQREFGGTGLGLAICKRLIELMDGEIGVESEEGRGSTFWFRLDLPVASAAARRSIAGTDISPREGRRLLLAEDVPLNQDLACAILRKAGYEVDVVGNGADAVRAVQDQRYDLVLMDIQMPIMDGMTATRRIRALDHAAASVPIIALTANVLPQQVFEFRASGMCDHVGKPFKRDALVAAIERWAIGKDRAPPEADLVDKNALDELIDILGRERVHRLLETLSEELQCRLGADGVELDRERLARDAHALISASGTLGFHAMAGLCREVEAACEADRVHDALIARLHQLRDATIREIEALRAA